MSDSIILGKIILLQSTLHALTDEKAIASFVCRGLSSVPGVDKIAIFIKDKHYNDFNKIADFMESFKKQNRFDLSDENFFDDYLSELKKELSVECIKIRTIFKNYGYLCIKYHSKKVYYTYKPYLENTVNLIALILENNEQKGYLMENQAFLEKVVKERTSELEKALNEKNILIQDIHHRVKNNLSQIYSLVVLEYDNYVAKENRRDPKDVLEGLKNRIMVISNLYSQLYTPQSNYDVISAKEYFVSILGLIKQAHVEERPYQLNLDIDDTEIPLKNNIHIGLIVNEIFSNIYKHAFTECSDTQNIVNVSFKKIGNQYILKIKDNGSGVDETIEEVKKKSLGMQLVEIFTQQLEGKLEMRSEHGLEYRITF